MAMDWDAVFDEDSDLDGDVTFALWEWFQKLIAVVPGVTDPSQIPDVPSTDDQEVQGASGTFYLSDFKATDGKFPLNRIQWYIAPLAGVSSGGYEHFLDPTTLDGALPSTTEPKTWDTLADFAAACVLNGTGQDDVGGTIANDVNGLNGGKGDGWRRRTLRKITSTSDTTDVDGNTIADGMVARLINVPYGDYRRTSGAWVKLPSTVNDLADLPDVLDSAVVDEGGGFYCAPGVSNADGRGCDLRGYWVVNELVAVAKLLYATMEDTIVFSGCDDPVDAIDGETKFADGGYPVAGDLSAAESDAQDNWDALVRFSSPPLVGGWFNGTIGAAFPFGTQMYLFAVASSGDGTNGFAQITAATGYVMANKYRALAGLVADVQLLMKGTVSGGAYLIDEYDGNGIAAGAEEWATVDEAKITTAAGAAPADFYLQTWFDKPIDLTVAGSSITFPAAPSGPGFADTTRGAYFALKVVFKWDLGSGAYTPANDDALTLTSDCPTKKCWHHIRGTPACPGADPTKADYTMEEIETVCAVSRPAAVVVSETNTFDDGFGGTYDLDTYEFWVSDDVECDADEDCTPMEQADVDDLRAVLPEQNCPVFTECGDGEDPPDTSDRTVTVTGAGDGPGGTLADDCDDWDEVVTVTYRGGGFFADSLYDLTEGIYGTTILCTSGHWFMQISLPSCGGASVSLDGPAAPNPDGGYSYDSSSPGFTGCPCSTGISATVG
jgi:hypothetical protein